MLTETIAHSINKTIDQEYEMLVEHKELTGCKDNSIVLAKKQKPRYVLARMFIGSNGIAQILAPKHSRTNSPLVMCNIRIADPDFINCAKNILNNSINKDK